MKCSSDTKQVFEWQLISFMASWDNKVIYCIPIQTIFQKSHAWTSLKHKLDMIKFQISFKFTLKLTFVMYGQFMFSCGIVIWFENCFNVVFNIWRHDENRIMCYVGMTLTASLSLSVFSSFISSVVSQKAPYVTVGYTLPSASFLLIDSHYLSVHILLFQSHYLSICHFHCLLLVSWSGCLLSSL